MTALYFKSRGELLWQGLYGLQSWKYWSLMALHRKHLPIPGLEGWLSCLFKSWCYHLPVVWPWASYTTSLTLGFVMYKIEIKIIFILFSWWWCDEHVSSNPWVTVSFLNGLLPAFLYPPWAGAPDLPLAFHCWWSARAIPCICLYEFMEVDTQNFWKRPGQSYSLLKQWCLSKDFKYVPRVRGFIPRSAHSWVVLAAHIRTTVASVVWQGDLQHVWECMLALYNFRST